MIGAEIAFFDMLVADVNGTVQAENKTHQWQIWAEILLPQQGTEVLATYTDQFYKGKAAAVTRKLGKGTVTYIGVESKDGLLEKQILRTIYKRTGVAIEDFPTGVIVEWRDGFYVGVNYTNDAFNLPIPKESKIVVGENPLPSAQVVVWR